MEFGKRELGLLLSDTVGDAATLRFTKDDTEATIKETLKPKIDPSKKITIYRAGQVPTWGHEEEEEPVARRRVRQQQPGGEGESQQQDRPVRRRSRWDQAEIVEEGPLEPLEGDEEEERKAKARARARTRQREVVEAEVIVGSSDSEDSDRDIESAFKDGGGVGRDSRRGEGMATRGSPTYGDMEVEGDKQEPDQEEEEEDVAARRARIRARLKTSGPKKELELMAVQDIQVKSLRDEESSGSSEWETDTDAEGEEADDAAMLKPVFVPKEKRATLIEQQAKEKAAAARALKETKEAEQRQRESRRLVAQEIRREKEQTERHLDNAGSDVDMPDDTDDPEELLEFEAWKVREMQRLTREKEEREAINKEKSETERRRNLTEEERRKEDIALGKLKHKHKEKWNFLQKYYHKGVFYMDEDSISDKNDVRKRDNTKATGEDTFNKEAMPKVMQVKNFGRSGQTKWKHLAAEDTTEINPHLGADTEIMKKYQSRLGGVGDPDAIFKRRQMKQAQQIMQQHMAAEVVEFPQPPLPTMAYEAPKPPPPSYSTMGFEDVDMDIGYQ